MYTVILRWERQRASKPARRGAEAVALRGPRSTRATQGDGDDCARLRRQPTPLRATPGLRRGPSGLRGFRRRCNRETGKNADHDRPTPSNRTARHPSGVGPLELGRVPAQLDLGCRQQHLYCLADLHSVRRHHRHAVHARRQGQPQGLAQRALDNVEHFKRVQRLWAVWGAVIWGKVRSQCRCS